TATWPRSPRWIVVTVSPARRRSHEGSVIVPRFNLPMQPVDLEPSPVRPASRRGRDPGISGRVRAWSQASAGHRRRSRHRSDPDSVIRIVVASRAARYARRIGQVAHDRHRVLALLLDRLLHFVELSAVATDQDDGAVLGQLECGAATYAEGRAGNEVRLVHCA